MDNFIIDVEGFINSIGEPYVKISHETNSGWIFSNRKFALFSILPNSPLFTPNHQFADHDIMYLYPDRWYHNNTVIKERILAKLGVFKSIFARKCRVISGVELEKGYNYREFLNKFHSYGYAKSKYKYALVHENEIVAVATFSSPRPLPRKISAPFENIPIKESKSLTYIEPPFPDSLPTNTPFIIHSYEWVRYASLPNTRVVGGMGKLLDAFIKEVEYPIFEVMTYSDNEISNGDVYNKLGFSYLGEREPIEYFVDHETFERLSERKLTAILQLGEKNKTDYSRIQNRGSKRFAKIYRS